MCLEGNNPTPTPLCASLVHFTIHCGFTSLCVFWIHWLSGCDVAVNSEGYPGAIGFQTRLLPKVYPVTLIRVDEETGEPMRDHRGLCVRCEPGLLLLTLLLFCFCSPSFPWGR